MFNQFDINIIIAVAFGVGIDAKFIGNYSSICLIQMMNLNEGFKKVKFDKSIFWIWRKDSRKDKRKIKEIKCVLAPIDIDISIDIIYLSLFSTMELIQKFSFLVIFNKGLDISVYLGGVPIRVHHAHMVCIHTPFNILCYRLQILGLR